MHISQKIELELEAMVTALECGIVRVLVHGKQRQIVQMMIERQDEAPVTLDDCQRVSKEASRLLDVLDIVKGTYTLEVSSPGLERPLTKERDFVRFVGYPIYLETKELVGRQKRFRGTLTSYHEGKIVMAVDGNSGEAGEVCVRYEDVLKAHLVYTG